MDLAIDGDSNRLVVARGPVERGLGRFGARWALDQSLDSPAAADLFEPRAWLVGQRDRNPLGRREVKLVWRVGTLPGWLTAKVYRPRTMVPPPPPGLGVLAMLGLLLGRAIVSRLLRTGARPPPIRQPPANQRSP
jgi:hypothetical protein